MFLTRLMLAARRVTRRSSAAALRGLHSPEEFNRILERERVRSDRTGAVFSLVVFTVGRRPADAETLAHLARILKRRLRLTDEAGRLDDRRIGVLLPVTPVAGAWTVIDAVCLCLPRGVPMPECSVYTYPSQLPAGDDEENAAADHTEDGRPARAMETLFVQRLPLWKRSLDIVVASVALVVLSPLFAVVAAAIKCTSPGPVLFRQKRGGLGGKEFTMLKFRSMIVDAESQKKHLLALNEQDGPAFKIKADPRVTRFGCFLRRTSIDELPQFWNVLRGEMSLVGPRPLPCNESAACRGWLRRRLDATPGLTCIWQTRGRSQVSFAEWARMDVRYIRSRSLMNDLKLMFLTLPEIIFHRGC
jgi:lipopolysaccharide/colanic/teichoic acid biosynthesis glycosyltransferase